jgi:hypothetical protein
MEGAMSELTINDLTTEFQMNLDRLASIVDETLRHIGNDDLDGAAVVLGSQSGKIAEFNNTWDALYAKLGDEGADPRRAVSGGGK